MNEATMALRATETDLPLENLEIDVSQIPSPALARLVEEVRNEDPLFPQAYDRVHNRHNR